jgi:hypothetical protein
MPNIHQGFARILKYGNPKHQEIIRGIQLSAIHLMIFNIGNSGDCAVEFPASTQQLINNGKISIIRAYGELRLRIDPVTASTYPGLEGTLVHETRHAYHMARVLSEMSHGKQNYFNPNGFEIEYSANVAYVEYVRQAVKLNHPDKNVLVNEAVNILKVAKQAGNNIVIDESGIRTRLWTQYGTNDTTHKGTKFSDNWKIYPKAGISAGVSGKIGI